VRGWWTLPAGYVEYGEDAAQTAAREALEETGLVVSIHGFHGIFAGFGDPRGAGHLAVFHATRVVGEPIAGDDAAEVRWFGADEIPTEIAFEGSRKAISAWLTQQTSRPREPMLMRYADAGPAPPILVYVVVENPRGSTDRVVYDEQSHEFKATGETFPAPLPSHYGWIPRTFTAADGEELDAIVIGEDEAAVGSVIVARTIGALLRADDDHKIIAVRADLPSVNGAVVDLEQRSDLRDQIEHVFAGRSSITGWASATEARVMVLAAQRDRLERENEARAEHATPALPAGTAG
jgi:ADP-ribose pyrophosphatase YjhB (NUDIX family)/inorganic pyrophosphatase